MSLTKVMLLVVLTALLHVCRASAEVTLTKEFPEDGDPICPGENVVYRCVVIGGIRLTWKYTSDAGGTMSHSYVYTDNVVDSDFFLNPFTLVLESISGSGSNYIINSTANATEGLTPADNGKEITCSGLTSEVMEVSFTVCAIPSTSSTEMGQSITNLISVSDLTTPPVSPTTEGGLNTTVILGVTVSLVAACVIAVCIVLLIFFLCKRLQGKGGSPPLSQAHGRKNDSKNQPTPHADVKESLYVDIKLHVAVKDNHHQYRITHCAISPDADCFVTADTSLVVNLWELGDQKGIVYRQTLCLEDFRKKMKSSKRKERSIPEDQKLLISLNWMLQNKELELMLAYDNCVLLWDIPNETVSNVFEPKDGYRWSGFSTPSILCAACSRFGPTYAFSFTKDLKSQFCKGSLLLRIKTVPDAKEGKKLAQEQSAVVSMIFGSNGKKLVTGNVDGVIQIYDVTQPERPCLKCDSLPGIIWEVQFGSADEKIIYTLVDGQRFYLWNTSKSLAPLEKMKTCEACLRPSQPNARNLANHPVTWGNTLFGSCCNYKYILINSKGKELLYKVNCDLVPESNSDLSEEHFSCLDCVTDSDTTFCVMVSLADNSVTFFKLIYGIPLKKAVPPAVPANNDETSL